MADGRSFERGKKSVLAYGPVTGNSRLAPCARLYRMKFCRPFGARGMGAPASYGLGREPRVLNFRFSTTPAPRARPLLI
jgi:hypothetical protein